MPSIILKMTALTVAHVVFTGLLFQLVKNRKMTMWLRILIGLGYGGCAVLSTHFGVPASHMLLNVRDIGPLAAGLFFDPLSGIIAGMIGGIERYIAGTYWGIGSYTRVACSIATCLAGFLAAFLRVFLYKRRRPAIQAMLFIGMVTEVFHMYTILITHRDDMDTAFFVVRVCAPPMILFTGFGLAAAALIVDLMSGTVKPVLPGGKRKIPPVSHKFRVWMFVICMLIFAVTFQISYSIQTLTCIQNAKDILDTEQKDIRDIYERIIETQQGVNSVGETLAAISAEIITTAVERTGGPDQADRVFLEALRQNIGLESILLTDREGRTMAYAGGRKLYKELLEALLAGKSDNPTVLIGNDYAAGAARCGTGMVQTVIRQNTLAEVLSVASIGRVFSSYHVENEGSFEMIRENGLISIGDHEGSILNGQNLSLVREHTDGSAFEADFFGTPSLCSSKKMTDDLYLLVMMPESEIYKVRNMQSYETFFADMLLLTVIYLLIDILVQRLVVNNLNRVNDSLGRITAGHLDEVVNVRSSAEFVSLTDDINHTVTALKGYIEAAEKRIEKELELARTIQASALPQNFVFPRSDFELYATMDPAKEVGGDFYDFFFVDRDRMALVVADVSGKGIPASLFMMRSKTEIRNMAGRGYAPSEILQRTNNSLCEGNEAEMFVTAWVGIIDLATGHMICASAGHEYPVLMKVGGDFELIHDRHGLVLAAMEGTRYRDYEWQLGKGDRLFVYTDGIPEAINEAEEAYGTDRLVKVLNRWKTEPMTDVLPAVRQDILSFTGEAEQFDDITMLGFTWNGSKAAEEQ